MSLRFILLLAALLFAPSADATNNGFAVVGYLPEYRLGGFDYRAAFQTGLTHLLFFSLEIDVKGLPAALDRLPSKEQAKQAREAADEVGGKILISFGGNSRSQNFGRMATSPTLRAAYLAALNRLLADYEFDGVDYNWEYPRNEAEWYAWGDLMRESKRQLVPRGNPSLTGTAVVTFTIYLDPEHYRIVQRYNLLRDADYVHCMAYDQPHHHATMAFYQSGIRYAKQYSLPLEKFTIGLPFYARHVNHGEPKTYAELLPELANDHDDQIGDYYFNSRSLIRTKTRSAVQQKVGGVMIWELGQDIQPLSRKDSLMSALKEGLADSAAQRSASASDSKRGAEETREEL